MPSIWSRAHPRFSFRPLAINVVSELRKPRPDSRVVNFIAAQPGETLFVTDITLAEIVFGIEQMGGCHAPDRPTSVARTQFAALICRPYSSHNHRRYRALEDDGGCGPEARPHIRSARSICCGDRSAAGFSGRDPGYPRVHRSCRACIRSVGECIPHPRQEGCLKSSGDLGSGCTTLGLRKLSRARGRQCQHGINRLGIPRGTQLFGDVLVAQ